MNKLIVTSLMVSTAAIFLFTPAHAESQQKQQTKQHHHSKQPNHQSTQNESGPR